MRVPEPVSPNEDRYITVPISVFSEIKRIDNLATSCHVMVSFDDATAWSFFVVGIS